MQSINSVIELREAIRRLEESQTAQGRMLKQQFCATVKFVRRASVLKNAVIELITSPGFLNALSSTVLSLTTRRNTQPATSRTTGKMFLRVLGIIVQFGIGRILAGKRRTRT